MKKRAFSIEAFAFFVLSFILLSTHNNSLNNYLITTLDRFISPVQGVFLNTALAINRREDDLSVKQVEEMVDKVQNEALHKEIQALRDQFQTSNPKPAKIMPASIQGFIGYIPAVSKPKEIIVNRGEDDGVKVGSAVVYKDVLIGKVDKLTSIRSRVVLLTKSGWSFTVTTQKGVDGLLVLEGGNLVLKNVLVSDPLSVGDIVLTKGDQELSGGGFPPGLIVGKVESVEKKPSSLFQTARVESPLKITKLSTVFIVR